MKKILLVSLLIISLPALSSTYTQPANVVHISVADTYARIKTDAMVSAESCVNQAWYRLDFGTNTEAMYSTILAAKVSGHKLYFALTGCTGDMPKITHIYLCETVNCS